MGVSGLPIPDNNWTIENVSPIWEKPTFIQSQSDQFTLYQDICLYVMKLILHHTTKLADGWITPENPIHKLSATDRVQILTSIYADLESLRDTHSSPELDRAIIEIRARKEELLM